MATTKKNTVNETEAVKPAQKKASTTSKKEPMKKRITLKDIDLNDLVEVKSCVYGTLEYISKKTGYRVRWSEFGQTEYMTVEELLVMRNSQRAFFEDQLIVLTGDNAADVINFLQLEKYYSHISDVEDVDKIFTTPPSKIPGVLKHFTDAAKENIARRAYDLIQQNELTDMQVIKVLEKSLGYQLTD